MNIALDDLHVSGARLPDPEHGVLKISILELITEVPSWPRKPA
jgi:hypothetical protein